MGLFNVAERAGFEPAKAVGALAACKAAAFDRSATSPKLEKASRPESPNLNCWPFPFGIYHMWSIANKC